MNDVHFSSERMDWETPESFFRAVDAEFGFTLDACATEANAKCASFISPEQDALTQPWPGTVWMNPPYGYGIGRWIEKAYGESQRGSTVVALIPARCETAWWHEFVMKSEEIRLIRGRMSFGFGGDRDLKGNGHNAPFPCVLVVFRPGIHEPRLRAMDRHPEYMALGQNGAR